MKTVSSTYLLHIYQACREQGMSDTALLPFIPGGLRNMQNLDLRFSIQCVFQILAHTAQHLTKPEIGLRVGAALRPSAFGDVGHALMLCKSLRHVIAVNRLYQPLTQQIGHSQLKEINGKAWLSWESGASDPEYYRHMTDVVMANHVQFGRWLSWVHNKKIEGVYFRHKKPEYADVYNQIFECPIYFGQLQDAMVFDIEAIDLPLSQPNEVMLAVVCKRLDIALSALDGPRSCQERLAYFMRSTLADGTPNIDKAAKTFNMSGRSLRRKLTQEGTTFRKVLEKIRRDLCEQLMTENTLSLFEISNQLGYSEQSAFNRAFKKWYGKTPKTYAHNIKKFNTAFDQLAP